MVIYSVKEHAIALARSFASPIVIMHNRGHIVPPLANEHLAVLRAFLTTMRDSPTPSAVIIQQQQKAAEGLEPLEPPVPVWETESEQVGGILAGKKQQRGNAQQQKAEGQQQQQGQEGSKGQFQQVVKLSGKITPYPKF